MIYDIGANCNAKYTTDDTIVHNDGEQTAVKKALRHFGYLYGNVNRYKWELIEDSLKKQRPIFAWGKKPSTSIGHAWVISGCAKLSCDVFKETNGSFFKRIEDRFVYCNVGEKEDCNGYYLSNVFNFNQKIADISALLSAEKDWYLRKKERSLAFYDEYCNVDILPDIRPDD